MLHFQTRNLCFFLLFSNSFSIQIHPQHYRYSNFFFFIEKHYHTDISATIHTIWSVFSAKPFFLCKYFPNLRINKIFVRKPRQKHGILTKHLHLKLVISSFRIHNRKVRLKHFNLDLISVEENCKHHHFFTRSYRRYSNLFTSNRFKYVFQSL